MRNTKVEHEAIDLYDVKLTDEDVKKHIKFVLNKEIDIHLRLASELSFKLLDDADVDVDKLEELEFHFIEAKESLVSFNKYNDHPPYGTCLNNNPSTSNSYNNLSIKNSLYSLYLLSISKRIKLYFLFI